MDESAWARYRERVRRDWADGTVGRKVEQRRVIEELLVQAAELDAQVTQVARSLNPDDFRAFLDMLTLMREAEFKAASGDGGESLQEWGARTDREMAAGQVPLERQPAISRMINVLGLPDKAVTARQFAPACPAATPLTGPDPVVYATAVEPLLERYSAAQPRVVIGSADEALVEELAVLAGDFQKLRDQQPAGGETWKVVQWSSWTRRGEPIWPASPPGWGSLRRTALSGWNRRAASSASCCRSSRAVSCWPENSG